jgi:hypothetical protein
MKKKLGFIFSHMTKKKKKKIPFFFNQSNQNKKHQQKKKKKSQQISDPPIKKKNTFLSLFISFCKNKTIETNMFLNKIFCMKLGLRSHY